MLQRWLRQLVVTMVLAALAPLAGSQTVSNIRVMLHPYAADPGKLPDATLARLQTLAAQPLTLTGTTRTGGLEFALAQPLNAADLAGLLQRLRNDRSVLWAQAVVAALVCAGGGAAWSRPSDRQRVGAYAQRQRA